MLMNVREIKRWLNTLGANAEVAIDEGGLALIEVDGDACLEVGGNGPEDHECQNCGTQFSEDELKPIEDLGQRVAPNEPMPSGQCPECGALCHPVEG